MNPCLLRAVLILALVSTGCISNYDFERARAPSGEARIAELRNAAEAVGAKDGDEGELIQALWIPLIYLEFNRFGTSEEANYPEGQSLFQIDGVGPLFMNVEAEAWYWDPSGELFERSHGYGIVWGFVTWGETVVRVPSGWRTEKHCRWLWGLLDGTDDVRYSAVEADASD